MNKLEAMKAFCLVAEEGSFTKAAKIMNLSATMVSRHVKNLEEELGSLLLKRNTRKVNLTEAGQHYRRHIKPLLKKIDLVDSQISNYSQEVVGTISISASIEFGSQYLPPMLAEFKREYGKVDVNVILSNEPLDLYESNIDLFLRVAPVLQDASHIAQQLTKSKLSLWASPNYLKEMGHPDALSDLHHHRCLFFNHSIRKDHWIFEENGLRETLKLPWYLSSNNGKLLNEASSLGMGIIQAPSYSVAKYVQNGELLEILPEYAINPLSISVIYPHKSELPKRVRVFIDFAKAFFQRNPVD